MAKSSDINCAGCKISMFCRGKEQGEPCETSLKAVGIAFVVPLCIILLILVLAQGRLTEGWTVLLVFVCLSLYFVVVRLIKPDFRKDKK